MAWTKEQREKFNATRAAKKAKKDHYSEIASIKGAPNETEQRLLSEINDLKAKLGIADAARSDAEKRALSLAESQGGLMQPGVHEVPTGRTVTVQRLDPKKPYKVVDHKDDGRDILRPNFVDVQVPTFFYKIDLPPVGGIGIRINGADPYYHGTTYEFDQYLLATVKDMVFRCWKHERDIKGSDENFYRKQQRPQLSARGM
jgi:hypothetical protein